MIRYLLVFIWSNLVNHIPRCKQGSNRVRQIHFHSRVPSSFVFPCHACYPHLKWSVDIFKWYRLRVRSRPPSAPTTATRVRCSHVRWDWLISVWLRRFFSGFFAVSLSTRIAYLPSLTFRFDSTSTLFLSVLVLLSFLKWNPLHMYSTFLLRGEQTL